MTQTHDDVPVTVFSGMLWEAELLKAMLVDAEIYAFLSDKIFGGVLPPIYSATDTGQVKVKVSSRDLVQAQAIVEEFLKNRQKE